MSMNPNDRLDKLAELVMALETHNDERIKELYQQVEALEVIIEEIDSRVKNLRNEG